MLRFSLVISFPREKHLGFRYLLWLQSLVHRFIHTNEERSTKHIPISFLGETGCGVCNAWCILPPQRLNQARVSTLFFIESFKLTIEAV